MKCCRISDKELVRQENNRYCVSAAVKEFRTRYDKQSSEFKKLLRDLEQYAANHHEPYIEMAKKNLRDLFVELRYDISDTVVPDDHHLKMERFSRSGVAAIRKVIRQIQFTATSRDSGNKVAVLFLDSKDYKRLDFHIYPFILFKELPTLSDIHVWLFIYSPDMPSEVVEEIKVGERIAGEGRHRVSHTKRRHRILAYSFSGLNNDTKLKEISDYFVEFDEQWRHIRRDLRKLFEDVDSLKRSIAISTSTTTELRYHTERIGQFSEQLKEVIERVGADIRADEESYNLLLEEYETVLEALEERKLIPDESIITKLSTRIDGIQRDMANSTKELNSIREEVDYYRKKDERYIKYGFQINPFIFTTPFNDSEMVGHERAKRAFDKFIHEVESGSEKRTLVISDEFGKGNTHLMHYFKRLITNQNYGKVLPQYIRCPPRYPEVDVIALYSQIVLEIGKQWMINEDLVREVNDILSKSTPPDTNEFILILRKILAVTYKAGYKRMILMIDEFENMLPEKTAQKIVTKVESNPRTLLQLKSMMDIQDLAFVIAIRKNWDSWHESLIPLLDGIDTDVIKLDSFDETNTKSLIEQRMSLRETPSKMIEFTQAAIKVILDLSKGIPRNIIRYAREALRIAILNEKEYVESKDVIRPSSGIVDSSSINEEFKEPVAKD
jgi:hypothetical protein